MIILFRDFYGGTAELTINRDGSAYLVVYDGHGYMTLDKHYRTERGARIALGRFSDCWHEFKREELPQ